MIVFDAHTHPEDVFDRFRWLGNMILEERPRSIVCGGDLGHLDSVSRHGERIEVTLKDDVAAIRHAQELVFKPITEWSRRQKGHRHAPHVMRKVLIKGNHEYRVDRAQKEDPMGVGSLVDFDDIAGFKVHWDEIHEYGRGVNVNGVWYTHTVVGKMGRPIALGTAAKQTSMHTIVGHTHSLCSQSVPTPEGVRFILSAPAFMPDGYVSGYAKGTNHGWCYGVLRVRPQGPTAPPAFDYVSMRELEAMYG